MPLVDQAAFDAANVVKRVQGLYFSHMVAMHVARHPSAADLAPPIRPGHHVPVLEIPAGDHPNSHPMSAHFLHYLRDANDPDAQAEFDKVWIIGALLTVGDILGANGFFGHIPEAEIIRHLRNGVAHGNRFNFSPSVLDRATGRLRYPAELKRRPWMLLPEHKITADMQGQSVLWKWGGPDAVMDCLIALQVTLFRRANGEPVECG